MDPCGIPESTSCPRAYEVKTYIWKKGKERKMSNPPIRYFANSGDPDLTAHFVTRLIWVNSVVTPAAGIIPTPHLLKIK